MPKFGFANMGYLMLLFERTFHKDLKSEKKKSERSLSTQNFQHRLISGIFQWCFFQRFFFLEHLVFFLVVFVSVFFFFSTRFFAQNSSNVNTEWILASFR